jgi:hypothetical protein
MSWCSDAPEDEAISLIAGLLADPDMTLSPYQHRPFINKTLSTETSYQQV